MWLLRRLAPDFKTITDFHRDNGRGFRGFPGDRARRAEPSCFCTWMQTCLRPVLWCWTTRSSVLPPSPKKVIGRGEIAEEAARLERRIAAYLSGRRWRRSRLRDIGNGFRRVTTVGTTSIKKRNIGGDAMRKSGASRRGETRTKPWFTCRRPWCVSACKLGPSLFGVLRSSAFELSASPVIDVVRRPSLLFGIGVLASHHVGVDDLRTASMCQNEVVKDLKRRRPSVIQIIRIGMDTSKHVFQLHGVNAAEEPILRKKLRRKSPASGQSARRCW